ncbi:MAG: Ig-like domain-containing protein [Myxococcales bacterium]|nr:Ig-like domain-containing protein [Myxococcales bacterium]
MLGRIAYVGMALGLCLALVAGLSLAQGCYSVPQPVCGFFCGASGACPDDYTCMADNRCHLNGAAATMCFSIDAGSIDADAPNPPSDVPIDGNVAPAVVQTTPSNGGTGVGVGSTVTATFSENVLNVSGATFTLVQGATPVTATVSYNAGSFLATLTPSAQLAANTTYTASVSSTIVDADGLPITTTSWSFTTGADLVAPSVVMTTPAAGGTGVAVTATVTARFDEAVIGVSGTTFTLLNGGTPIPGTVTYTAGTKTATFTPTGQLPANTLLTATLTAGITDVATNALSGAPVTWTFTTGADNVAPTVLSTTPSNGATAVSVNAAITVLFDEPVLNVSLTSFTVNDGSAVSGVLTAGMGGRSWTITPAFSLAAAATVTVTLTTAITDNATNPLAAPVTFTFMTQ